MHGVLGYSHCVGTHDLYAISVTVTSFHPYVVQVMGDIVDGSSSLGILTIVYSDSLVKYNFVPNDETRLGVYNVTVCDLTNGEYEVAVFIMEKNGKPFPRAVSRPKDIKINGKIILSMIKFLANNILLLYNRSR